MEILLFVPFRLVFFPLLKILANEAASEGFSATINTVFIICIWKAITIRIIIFYNLNIINNNLYKVFEAFVMKRL